LEEISIPENHPRYLSLVTREKIIHGMDKNVVAPAGLIAHGRGEAFDYLLGEQTPEFSLKSIEAGVCAILLAKKAVLSVNGNVVALCPKEVVELSRVSGASIEINLFYRSRERELAILEELKSSGADGVLGVGDSASAVIPELGSERRRVDPHGIYIADVVFVPLEDGDRTEALVAMGKKVIAVDLNPLSRTAQRASITIVDNIVRVLPAMVEKTKEFVSCSHEDLSDKLLKYDNNMVLNESLRFMADRLRELSGEKD